MTGERVRGLILFSTAAVLVAAGATWWIVAAPEMRANDAIEQWRVAVEQQLPDADGQESAETTALNAGADQTFESSVDTGKYVVSVICRGGPGTFARVSLSRDSTDSGVGLDCAEESPPETFEVGLADAMRLNVTIGDAGPVVFRYSFRRAR